jgi:hypothetical protein
MLPTTFGLFGTAMFGLYGIFGIIAFVFWVIQLVDAIRRRFVDPNMKIVWILVIVLLNWIGALIYYFVGKSQGDLPV